MKLLQGMMKKEKLVVILLLGLLLLIAALPVKEREVPQMLSEEENGTEQVKGVGEAEVILTCEGTEKNLVEKDEQDTVYTKDAKGNQIPYLTSQEYPKVLGVVVVAEGGDNPVIIRNIQEAVQVLFQVEAHKIKVMKMN